MNSDFSDYSIDELVAFCKPFNSRASNRYNRSTLLKILVEAKFDPASTSAPMNPTEPLVQEEEVLLDVNPPKAIATIADLPLKKTPVKTKATPKTISDDIHQPPAVVATKPKIKNVAPAPPVEPPLPVTLPKVVDEPIDPTPSKKRKNDEPALILTPSPSAPCYACGVENKLLESSCIACSSPLMAYSICPQCYLALPPSQLSGKFCINCGCNVGNGNRVTIFVPRAPIQPKIGMDVEDAPMTVGNSAPTPRAKQLVLSNSSVAAAPLVTVLPSPKVAPPVSTKANSSQSTLASWVQAPALPTVPKVPHVMAAPLVPLNSQSALSQQGIPAIQGKTTTSFNIDLSDPKLVSDEDREIAKAIQNCTYMDLVKLTPDYKEEVKISLNDSISLIQNATSTKIPSFYHWTVAFSKMIRVAWLVAPTVGADWQGYMSFINETNHQLGIWDAIYNYDVKLRKLRASSRSTYFLARDESLFRALEVTYLKYVAAAHRPGQQSFFPNRTLVNGLPRGNPRVKKPRSLTGMPGTCRKYQFGEHTKKSQCKYDHHCAACGKDHPASECDAENAKEVVSACRKAEAAIKASH